MRSISNAFSKQVMRMKYIPLLVAFLLAFGCSEKSADIKWDISDKDIVAAKAQPAPSLKANIYIDATTSMAGFAANRDSVYNKFLNDLEGSIIAGWKSANIGFYKFGTKAKELNHDQFRTFSSQKFYAERGVYEKTNIDAVINAMDNTQVNIVVTDLFQNDGDVNAILKSIKDGCFAKGIYMGIVGIKSDYNGMVFDAKVPSFPFKSAPGNEETYRPFYALIFGEKNNIERLFEQIKANKAVKEENFILISKYIVNKFDIPSLTKDKASKDLNLNGRPSDKQGNKQFNFTLKEGREGNIIAEISFEKIPKAPAISESAVNIMAYRKFAPKGQANVPAKAEDTNDITAKEIKVSNGNKINAKLNVTVGDAAGMYSYLVYVQPAQVNGYVLPKWVEEFSSDNPTPKNDANKTLNLKPFIAGLLNANAAVTQPKIAQMIINVKKL